MHAYINSVLPRYGGGSRSSDDRVTPTINIDGKDNSGCTIPAVIIAFLIIIFAFNSGSSKKARTYDYNQNNVTKKYNYQSPENLYTPQVITPPKSNITDEDDMGRKQLEDLNKKYANGEISKIEYIVILSKMREPLNPVDKATLKYAESLLDEKSSKTVQKFFSDSITTQK